jgi:DNA-binding LacI/PurR family transcriptional regulator
MLDNINNRIDGKIVKVYQDFENDIYDSLIEAYKKIVKYKKLVMIYPEKSVYPYPKRIVHGFRKFCIEKLLDFEVIDEIYDDMILKKGDLFITIVEDDLVNLIKQIRDNEYTIGEDIGVLSYNDTPLKDLLGISVVSTDFNTMGETVAQMILSNEKGEVKNPFNFIDRASM